jgi:restriction system protein
MPYSEIIENHFLGKSKIIRGNSLSELQARIAATQAQWAKEEERVRQRNAIQDLKSKAEAQTEEAQLRLQEYQSILQHTLRIDDRLAWEELYDRAKFRHVPFSEPEPNLSHIFIELEVPQPSWLEFLFAAKKQRRMELEEKAKAEFEARVARRAEKEASHTAWMNRAENEHEQRLAEANGEIDKFRAAYEAGEIASVERYATMVLNRSEYPDGFVQDFNVQYNAVPKSLIVDFRLPTPSELPHVVQYRFVQTRRAIDSVEMKSKDFDAFYESVLYQVVIRTIHEIFEADYAKHVESVVFNGWVPTVDKATGKDLTAFLLSCHASREQFEQFNLSRVDPKETFRALKGLQAGPLAQLAPVRPIMQINREDKRFIEGREVLEGIDPSENLATMPWDDFEHLVRELFSEIFSAADSEVRVTQASRDGGIDAVAFDPDPIRGGKFVIQAKRYAGLVSVSAVRDLYGTMINEGAAKGILVTTGHFGNDSREFAKDKPITLIDGSNLVYLFQQHGHEVRIEAPTKAGR